MKKTVILISIWSFFFSFNSESQTNAHLDSIALLGKKYHDMLRPMMSSDSIILLAGQAAEYLKEANDSVYYASCLSWLTYAYYNKKNWGQAMHYADIALKNARKQFGKESAEYAYALSNRAIFSDLAGDYIKAIQLTQQAVAVERKVTPDSLVSISYSLQNLGSSYQNMGDYEEALSYLKEAERLRANISANADANRAGLLYSIALCAYGNRQLITAYEYAQQCLSHIRTYQPIPDYLKQNQLDVCHLLANYHHHHEKIDSAIFYTKIAESIQEKDTLANDYKTFEILGNIALREQRWQDAILYFNKGVNAAQYEFKEYTRHPLIASCTAKLANAYRLAGQISKSAVAYQKALQWNSFQFDAGKKNTNPLVSDFINTTTAIEILSGKGRLLYEKSLKEKTNQPALRHAFQTYKLLDQLILQSRLEFKTEQAQFILSSQVVDIYEQAIDISLRLHEVSKDDQYLNTAFGFAESNKAVLLFSKQKEWKAKNTSDIPDSLLNKERQLQVALSYYQESLASANHSTQSDEENISRLEKRMFELKQSIESLNKIFEDNYPIYFKQKNAFDFIDVQTVQKKLLSPDKALIEYFVGTSFIFVFAVTNQTVKTYRFNKPEGLDKQLMAFLAILKNAPTTSSFTSNYQPFTNNAYYFYQLLLAQPLRDLPKTINRLCIVSDDALHFLPFGILLSKSATPEQVNYAPTHLSYLIKDYAIQYAFSSRVMLSANAKPKQKQYTFLGIAPVFAGPSPHAVRNCADENLAPLVCNQSEVQQIADLFNPRKIQISEDGSTASFKRLAASFQIIHLATHACADPSNPQFNKIYFSDGALSHFDLSNIHLNADLAVLSACNTGTGTLYKGEGIMSLARSFANAGCTSLLTTLWSVDDCSTADLMLDFYKNLHQGQAKDVALQQASLQYLATAPPARRHPYFWGSFMQIGSSQPLFQQHANYKWWLLLATGILGIIIFFIRRKTKNNLSNK